MAEWHLTEPAFDDAVPEPSGLEALEELILRQHWYNFSLWHVEDRARRRDVTPAVIADCKYAIDGLNQRRNDLMEKVDACLIRALEPILPACAEDRHNTESPGAAVDRMSILALKIFHMCEQTERDDVDAGHVDACQGKLAVLEEQRADLERSILELVGDYAAGRKRPKVYFQFKMYNDPKLNPELYGGDAACVE